MYGVLLPYDLEIIKKCSGDIQAHTFNGRDGKKMVVGKVFDVSDNNEPLVVPDITDNQKMHLLLNIICVLDTDDGRFYGNSEELNFYYIKKY
jgi:hypothetical protein